MTKRKAKDFTETTISSRTVYRGRLLHVLEEEVRLPDGKRTTREFIRHTGAVMMLPFLDRDTVLLVRQFRYPLARHFLEIPAGKIDPGEAPLETARRELREECGLDAGRWRHLTTIHPCIGYSNERIEFYDARELTQIGHAPEEGEFIETVPVALAEALQWVKARKITDAKTIIGLMWIKSFARA